MRFAEHERDALLALKGVGPAVIGRLEQLGYHSLAGLRGATALSGSTCWRNSPQARAAIGAVLALAEGRSNE